jgi:hypothetical protein
MKTVWLVYNPNIYGSSRLISSETIIEAKMCYQKYVREKYGDILRFIDISCSKFLA